jgi:hypothetical protein
MSFDAIGIVSRDMKKSVGLVSDPDGNQIDLFAAL